MLQVLNGLRILIYLFNKMVDYPQKVFTIHFPDKKVYVENTCKSFSDKMEYIKNDKDHLLYELLKKYPNPEIRFGVFTNMGNCFKDKKEVAKEYSKDNYEILNFNLLPPPSFNLFQSLYKWMKY